MRIGVKAVGPGSSRVRDVQPGTRVAIEGPFGRLTARAQTQRKVALLGAGVGITPIRALAESLPYAPDEAIVLQRYSRDPLFADEFIDLAQSRGLRLLWLPGQRRWSGSCFGSDVDPNADDASVLLRMIPDIAERDVYLCGPPAWSAAVKSALTLAGVPQKQVHAENFQLVKS